MDAMHDELIKLNLEVAELLDQWDQAAEKPYDELVENTQAGMDRDEREEIFEASKKQAKNETKQFNKDFKKKMVEIRGLIKELKGK